MSVEKRVPQLFMVKKNATLKTTVLDRSTVNAAETRSTRGDPPFHTHTLLPLVKQEEGNATTGGGREGVKDCERERLYDDQTTGGGEDNMFLV